MDIKAYAKELRGHDWMYAMSDSHGVWAAGERNLLTLKELRAISSNHCKLFDLAAKYYTQMEGSDYEKAWRYVGAHLWVHGKKLSEEQAKDFVNAKDDKHWGTVYRVDWGKVSEELEGSGNSFDA